MNYYQKMYGLVSLLLTGMTAMIVFIFFDSPYTKIFQIETAAIIWAELLIGLCVVYNVRKNDSVLVHAAGYTVVAFGYLFFTLAMIYFACENMPVARFLALHISAFAIAVVVMIFFVISEHHLNDQEQSEDIVRVQRSNLRSRMQEIAAYSDSAFVGNQSLLKRFHILADEVRFLPDPSPATVMRDREIEDVVQAMEQAVKDEDQSAFSEKIDQLTTLFKIRGNQI